ncbi:ubiquitin carboxyl-terminal hydrolase 37-like [Amphiura filiformis]|uniref:ubiquitin carboxyl-terminal hydrolase 37-like n=1 Tax=Amphiura filiformis TaxID=82378 RepID=UPI003B2193CA
MNSVVTAEEILCSASGDLKYTSVEAGSQTNWKQGNLQLAISKTGQYVCILNYKIGHARSFSITNNVKKVSNINTNPGRVTLALKDGANISLNKGNVQEVRRLINALDEIKAAKSARKILNGTRSFDLPGQLTTTPRSKGSITPVQDSLKKTPSSNGIRPLGNTNISSARKYNGPPNGATLSQAQHVAMRRSTAGFDMDDDDDEMTGALNATISSDDETSGGVSALFVDEQDDQLDKENRSMSEPRGVYHQRRKEGVSIFMQSCSEKIQQAEEKKAKTPVVAMTNKNFYGSRGKEMAFMSRLGGGAALSQRTNSAVKRPGYMEPTSNYIKKQRTLDAYDGWRTKSLVSKPNNISLHGFSNLGNTCYMNAILQSLFGLNSFTNDLLKAGTMQAVRDVSLYWAVTSLLEAKQQRVSAEQMGNKLRLVKTAISVTATRFSGFMQHDAHEFLCQCMDQLKEDVDVANKERQNEAEKAGVDLPPQLPCPITCNFEFEVLHTIRCKECAKETTKTEEFYDLSVDMPRISIKAGLSASIQTALDQFFKPEEIEYTCSECGGKSASVVHKFTKLPRILILHLKRYTFDIEASVNAKLRQPIGIPKYLTLAWHCNKETLSPVPVTRIKKLLGATPSSSDILPDDNHLHDGNNHSNIRKRLNFPSSPDSESRPHFHFKSKRPRQISDSDLEKDPFNTSNDEETQKALEESKAEDEKRRQEEDAMKKAIEDSKHDVGGVDGVKDLARMTEEEQLEYALALSRGDCPTLPAADANGNHKFTGATLQNGHDVWLNGHDAWSNGIESANDGSDINGVDEPDVKLAEFGELTQRLTTDSGDVSLTKLADYPQLGELEQGQHAESSRTGDLHNGEMEMHTSASFQPQIFVNGTEQFANGQWENRETTVNNVGDMPALEQSNGDSGFASPDMNGQLDNTEASGNHDNEDFKLTANDSAIDIPPPSKGSKTDYSNVIDLCGDDGNDPQQSAGGKDTAVSAGGEDTGGNGLSYAELKAKEEEEIRRATELSLQDCKHLEETEEAQLRRAQEMSLEEFNKSMEESMDWDHSPPADEKPTEESPMYTMEQLEAINANLDNGNMPHSYRLVSVVNHIGTSSSAGHYVSDVYNTKKDSWFSYDDSDVQKIQESVVREERQRSGYIFFYAVNYD